MNNNAVDELLSKYPVTYLLLVANIVIFVMGVLFNMHHLFIQTYAFSLERIGLQQFDVFLTSGFLHSDPAHLLYNALFLWIFGRVCEDEFGHFKTLTIYFVAMATGSLFFAALFPAQQAVGASGAISGLIAAAILVAPGRNIYNSEPAFPIALLALAFLLPTAVNAFNLAGNTANIAHVGGVVAGAFLTVAWNPENIKNNLLGNAILWGSVGITLLLLLITLL